MINIGIVGLGRWGSNLLRTFATIPECRVTSCYDINPAQHSIHHGIGYSATDSYDSLLKTVDAVVIATPATTHYDFAMQAIMGKKAVFVEKPLCLKLSQAEMIERKAREKDVTLMVGHLFLYHPAIIKMRKAIEKGAIGKVFSIHSSRLNWGVIRKEENALYSLAPHDISIINYLLTDYPKSAFACGGAFLEKKVEDTIMLSLSFKSGVLATSHLSWINPQKERKVIVVGSKGSMVFDDQKKTGCVVFYKDGKEVDSFGSYVESLREECNHFIESVDTGIQPRTDGKHALAIAKVLDAAMTSLQSNAWEDIK